MIAEEVAAVYPELVANDAEGRPYTVRYQYLAPMLLNEVQKQARLIDQQSQQLQEQARHIAELEKQVGEIATLKAAIAALQARGGTAHPTSSQAISVQKSPASDSTAAAAF